jgi:hypothetical protein
MLKILLSLAPDIPPARGVFSVEIDAPESRLPVAVDLQKCEAPLADGDWLRKKP